MDLLERMVDERERELESQSVHDSASEGAQGGQGDGRVEARLYAAGIERRQLRRAARRRGDLWSGGGRARLQARTGEGTRARQCAGQKVRRVVGTSEGQADGRTD